MELIRPMDAFRSAVGCRRPDEAAALQLLREHVGSSSSAFRRVDLFITDYWHATNILSRLQTEGAPPVDSQRAAHPLRIAPDRRERPITKALRCRDMMHLLPPIPFTSVPNVMSLSDAAPHRLLLRRLSILKLDYLQL